MPEADWFFSIFEDRDGVARNADGSFPRPDGAGCPLCGAIRNGGHGGGCQHQGWAYDEDGAVLGRSGVWDKEPAFRELRAVRLSSR